MKTFKLVCTLFFGIVLFQSCSDDDEVNQADLIGIWNVNDVEADITVNELDIIQYLTEEAGYSTQEAIIFEGIYRAFYEATVAEATFEFKADNSYEVKIPNQDDETGTWTLNSNATILTIDEGTNDEAIINIQTLTSNTLVVVFEEEEIDDLDEDGTDETLLVNVTLNLSK